jgi:hypothetical protein
MPGIDIILENIGVDMSEGLENALDSFKASVEDYIYSKKSEGYSLLGTFFNMDGYGYNMPAMPSAEFDTFI